MHPLRLDGVELGTFGGQKERRNPNAFALLLDLGVVLTNPDTYLFADMPGGVIPNQQPGGLALRLQSGATPLQKLGRDGADWATCDETQRHLLADRISGRSLLPKRPIAGEGFRVGIPFFPGLFHQAPRLILILPGMDARKGKPAPPYFLQKTNRPGPLLAGPSYQPIARVFFSRTCGSGLLIQPMAPFHLFPERMRAR